ncbi:MAG: GyrI-like domain-containing protein [Bacteroidales bacterium]
MKTLKIVIIILVVILGIILIPPLFMPSELFIERSKVLTAQPEVIWDQVNCLDNWEQWDVWHQDSNMTGYYEGPQCGVGSRNIWTYKNTDDGGSQTITEAKEFAYIKTFLDFQKMGSADAELFFEKVPEGTKVTWNLRSDSPYPIMRWISTLMIKPGVVEAYETGLNNLEELTKDMKLEPKYSTGEITVREVKQMNALAIRSECTADNIANEMGMAFGAIMQYIDEGGANIAGAPFSIWYKWEDEIMVFDNAIPVNSKMKGNDKINPIVTYQGKVANVSHTGDYSTTQYSWLALEEYVKANGYETNGDPWETYITDPQNEPNPNNWVTELNWPIK